MNSNQLIENFWISQGGKANLSEDIDFYESDWNMLMPVVQQIRKLGFSTNHNYDPDSNIEYFSIYDSQYRKTANGKTFYAEGKNCTYDSVVKFIYWYNTKLK